MRRGILVLLLLTVAGVLRAQEGNRWFTHFGIESNLHYSTQHPAPQHRFMGGTYATAKLWNSYFDIEARLEELSHPLPGREAEKGWGIPYLALTGRYKGLSLTLGDVYEQFGNGTLLRTYEDRALGLDNSLRGGRLRWSIGTDVFTIKLVAGQQRYYFDRGWAPFRFSSERGYLAGADAELALHQLITPMQASGVVLYLGGSYIYKHEATETIQRLQANKLQQLILPTGVDGWSARLLLTLPQLDLHIEHAQKSLDPSLSNNYIYRTGSLSMLTLSYVWGNSNLFFGARRAEDFDFRSARSATENSLKVNFLQPFVKQQTYTLAALHPYATQATGEWAYQANFSHRFVRGTALGGKHGTTLSLHGSLVYDLHRNWLQPEWQAERNHPDMVGTDGYTAPFFGVGELLFSDFGAELAKKVTPRYNFTLSYLHQYYHQARLEGHGEYIRSHIFIYDAKHRLTPTVTLRNELQYLHSRQAEGSWLFGLLECSVAPHWVFTFSDLWNPTTTRKHYYMASVATIFNQHRLQLSYGTTRAGINCSGGVCRYMPATEGLFLTYNLSI